MVQLSIQNKFCKKIILDLFCNPFFSHLTGQDKVGQLLMRLDQHLEAPEDVTVLFVRAECKQDDKKQEEGGSFESDHLKVEINSDVESGNEAGDFEKEDIEEFDDVEDEYKDGKEEAKNTEVSHNVPKEEGTFPCDKCDYVATKKINLHQHTKRLHSGLDFTCSHCHEEFGNETKLNRHILKEHDVERLQCQHCDFEALKPRSMEAHKAVKHKDLGYGREKVDSQVRESCEECGRSFKNASTLWHHVQKFHLDNPKQPRKAISEKKERMCPVCSKTFTLTQSQMTIHKQKCEFEKTGELKFICEMCGRGFWTIHQQCSHRAICLGKTKITKNKKCPHENCDYVTRTKIELENHVRQYHLNLPIEKNHICNHCGKAYNLLYQLKQHIKAVHLEIRPFVCPECGRTFARKDKLQDHIDLHKGLFKYKCPFCQKGLNNSGALCNHKRICTSNPERFSSLNDARIARERLMPPQPLVPPPKMYF